MGRWYYFNRKQEVDSLLKISVYRLKRYDFLLPKQTKSSLLTWKKTGSSKEKSVAVEVSTIPGMQYMDLKYTLTKQTGEKTHLSYKVPLTTTPCYFGGYRYWFICPLVKNGIPCRRRVGILYLGGTYFGCRHCYNLTYRSRNENRHFRFHTIGKIWDNDEKIVKLEDEIKRPYYRGKPTRKQRRLAKLYQKAGRYWLDYKANEI